MGEGTPQSSALTEGDFVPDSPTLSPIELKQELPKYLPALQVRVPPQAGSAVLTTTGPVAGSRSRVPSVVVCHGLCGERCNRARPLASHMSVAGVQALAQWH